jgi:hypothetical protein
MPSALERQDGVVQQVIEYGETMPKIGTLSALRAMSGARAEVALWSLSRAYFANCMRRSARWTSGVHLAWWALNRLSVAPDLKLHDLQEPPSGSLDELTDLAQWYVISARLLVLLDFSAAAKGPLANGLPQLSSLVVDGFIKVPAGHGEQLRRFLARGKSRFEQAFPEAHYRRLAKSLHRDEADAPAS